MNTISQSIFLALALTLSCSAFSKDTIKCNSGGNQLEMNACADDDFVRADRELNKTYQALIEKEAEDPVFIAKLRAAQKAWLAFRDAELEATFACDKDDSHICWGSMLPMCYSYFKADLTRQRTKRLKQLLKEGRPADGCH